MLQDPVLVSERPVRELLFAARPCFSQRTSGQRTVFAARPCFSQRTSGQRTVFAARPCFSQRTSADQAYQAYASTSVWSMSEQQFSPVQDATMRSGMAISDLPRL